MISIMVNNFEEYNEIIRLIRIFWNDPKLAIWHRESVSSRLSLEEVPESWRSIIDTKRHEPNSILSIWGNYTEFDPITDLLNSKIDDVAFLIRQSVPIGLIYIFSFVNEGKKVTDFYLGLTPIKEISIKNLEDNHGILFHETYKAFLKVHNGFLRTGNFGFGFLPLGDTVKKDQFIHVYNDGSGNEKGFMANSSNDERMVDFDHETQKFVEDKKFLEVLCEFI